MGAEDQFKKGLSIGIIVFLAGASIASALNTNHSPDPKTDRDSWLYVGGGGPGNYSTIQSALDAANPGDTVFVYPGTYYENVRIQKTIDVIGQNRNTTIIDGNETGTVVNVTADHVNLSGFTIRHSGQYGNPAGITVKASHCTIVDTVIANNSFGIIFGLLSKDQSQDLLAFNPGNQKRSSYYFENNTVMHNIFSTNGAGVLLYTDASHNTIDGNTFLHNRYGVAVLPGSHHNVLSNSTFHNDGLFVSNQSYANTVVNNTVNGEPLLYLEEQTNQTITEEAGQIILVRCHNVTIRNQEITNACLGIELIDTTQASLSQNLLSSNNYVGILLWHSSNNIMEDNIISFNGNHGIQLWGNNNTIAGNTISNNTNDGLYLYHSNNNTIVNNDLSNNSRGIYLEFSRRNTLVSGNRIHENKDVGIRLWKCRDSILLNNQITSNFNDGIIIDASTNTVLFNNTISQNAYGIRLTESTSNFLLGNTITACYMAGILLESSSDQNLIAGGNSLCDNGVGIIIEASGSNTVSANTINDNLNSGIEVIESRNTIIAENSISWNRTTPGDRYGVILFDSTNNTLLDNTIFNATYGVGIDYRSGYNSIRRNTISQSLFAAIRCSSFSSHTDISVNTLRENGIGVSIGDSGNNTITNNVITRSTNTGIDISISRHNLISGNNVSANQDGIDLGLLTSDGMVNDNTILDNHGTGIRVRGNKTFIIDNIVSKNTLGINISGDSNTVDHNLISNNSLGITIYYLGRRGLISSNDFLNNTRNAKFKELFKYRHNVWTKNYWDRPRVLPHPIFGRMSLRSFAVSIPWVTFDWHPAAHPNHTS